MTRVLTPGWSPPQARLALANARSAAVPTFRLTAVPPPAHTAYSLDRHRRRVLDQGPMGTCWVHSATQHAETFLTARGFPRVPDVCRNLVGYGGKLLEGGGNPDDGGSPTDSLRCLSDDVTGGLGLAHEGLWPYVPDRGHLAVKPTAAILADARAEHLFARALIRPQPDFAQLAALLDRDIGVCNGIWWPDLWGQPGPLFDRAGPAGGFGHSVYLCGYAQPGVLHAEPCLQIRNSWGRIYHPLTPTQAQAVTGYVVESPTDSFWVTVPAYLQAVAHAPQDSEHVTITDAQGLAALDLADALAAL